MPALSLNNPSNIQTLQQVANSMRSYPELTPLMGVSGWTQEPTISIANDVMQRILAQGMDWKWNRANATGFLSNGLQQDYVTNILDMGWVEAADLLDINNTSMPKPRGDMEGVRDLKRSSRQGVPFNISYIPNKLAIMGTWFPLTAYSTGYGFATQPVCPIQQFIDVNGNILFINSAVLNLQVDSPGYNNNTSYTPPSNYPYGISGSVKPSAPANSPAGTNVQDGTVIWTVAEPLGIAFRIEPMSAQASQTYLINPIYQRKAPIFTSLQQTIDPIPSEYSYLFRQGFVAFCYDYAASKKAMEANQKWELALMTALREADRETEEHTMYPSQSITQGGGGWRTYGPAWPY